VVALSTHCKRLQRLYLRAPKVDDGGIDGIISNLSESLTHLVLECVVRDVSLSKMGSLMTSLRSLEVYRCPIVTVHGLERLVQNSQSLSVLGVQNCRHVKLDTFQTKGFVKKLTREGMEGSYKIVTSVVK
jgi:hypothetical protein